MLKARVWIYDEDSRDNKVYANLDLEPAEKWSEDTQFGIIMHYRFSLGFSKYIPNGPMTKVEE